jgi:predicted transcriptional regulator
MPEDTAYKPSSSQRQADMVHHALHDEEYRAKRKLSREFVEGMHAANVAAQAFGKHLGLPCPKCEEKKVTP